MTLTLTTLCYLFAFICFIAAALGAGRVGWRDLGFAFLTLSLLV